VDARENSSPQRCETSAGRLGHVLYGRRSGRLVSENEWVDLVRLVAAGAQPALHALYERAHRVVFTLCLRVTRNRETAEEVTLDVFHDVWRRAWSYDPANGTVLGWIMNQARSRAIDRMRFEGRQKRRDPESMAAESPEEAMSPDPRAIMEAVQRARALHSALAVLTAAERQAIESAFFSGLTHAELAGRLNEPLGTVKTRIRSGLQKLRQAMGDPAQAP
jgi:RNA polymerase sigma-70 factor (ECF subfamily)